ncbi:hypothetical protein PNI02_03650 [Pseudoalteromonas nigrifaciens]|nr:hypothetical protein PNI02_03650 [Pseudoalteromonas nigrifaciens]
MLPETSLVDCLNAYNPIPSITTKYNASEIIIPVSKFASTNKLQQAFDPNNDS